MKSFLIACLNTTLSIALLSYLVKTIQYTDYLTLVAAGVVLTLLNMVIKPILKLLFLPINIVTLGLFSWLITVFILWLATVLVPGFVIQPTIFLGVQLGMFGTLVLMAFLLSLSQTFVGIFIK